MPVPNSIVEWVHELPARRSRQTPDGKEAVRVFQVKAQDAAAYEDTDVIKTNSTPDLPVLGQDHPDIPNCFCKDVDGQMVFGVPELYEFRVLYTSSGAAIPTENPWDLPARIAFNGSTQMIAINRALHVGWVTKYINSAGEVSSVESMLTDESAMYEFPITNSAADPPKPLPEHPVPLVRLRIRRDFLGFSATLASAYVGKSNNNPFLAYPARQLLITSIEGDPQRQGLIDYYTVTVELQQANQDIHPNWDIQILDQGRNELSLGDAAIPGFYIKTPIIDPYDGSASTDHKLDGNGLRLKEPVVGQVQGNAPIAYYERYRKIRSVNFDAMGLF